MFCLPVLWAWSKHWWAVSVWSGLGPIQPGQKVTVTTNAGKHSSWPKIRETHVTSHPDRNEASSLLSLQKLKKRYVKNICRAVPSLFLRTSQWETLWRQTKRENIQSACVTRIKLCNISLLNYVKGIIYSILDGKHQSNQSNTCSPRERHRDKAREWIGSKG